jgi:hypothetical protein
MIGRGRRGAAALAALVMAAGFAGVAGCSSHAQTAAADGETPSGPLTVGEAAGAFRTFVAADSVARASGDERLALSLTADGQAKLTAAAYRKAAFSGVPVPRYHYGAPQLFVPTIKGYPRWFVAMADRWQGGRKRTDLMAFMKPEQDGRWQLSLSTLLAPGVRPPRPVRDAHGLAEALPTTTTGLVAQPKMAGALQATMVEEGPDGPSAGVIATGPDTSGLYRQITRTKRLMRNRGLAYDAIFTATTTPMFVLRTADGGALALYCYNLETTTLVRKARTVDRVPVPQNVAHLLDKLVIKRELDTTETHQYAAAIPLPRGKDPNHPLDPIRVIASDGAVTGAEADGK